MSEFLDQMLNEEDHNRRLIDARNRAARSLKEKFTFSVAKEEPDLIPTTPELRELEAFLANAKKNSKPVIEKSYQEKLNELARPAMRWYPSWADFVASTTPTGSCCLRCGHPLGGRATGVCDECDEILRKEFKDSAPDFRFSEWD